MWLDVEGVKSVLGAGSYPSDDDADAVMEAALAAARDYVEQRRGDLVTTDDADVTAFRPTPAVTWGTAMLAYRLYLRRTSPLGVAVTGFEGNAAGEILRHDPDLERMLGVGSAAAFVFGGARRRPTEAVAP